MRPRMAGQSQSFSTIGKSKDAAGHFLLNVEFHQVVQTNSLTKLQTNSWDRMYGMRILCTTPGGSLFLRVVGAAILQGETGGKEIWTAPPPEPRP